MGLRMNRGILKRLSIVLTVLLIAGNTVATASGQISNRIDGHNAYQSLCLSRPPDSTPDYDECQRNSDLFWSTLDRGQIWQDAFLQSLAITAAIWVLIGLTYAVARWVLNGRTEESR